MTTDTTTTTTAEQTAEQTETEPQDDGQRPQNSAAEPDMFPRAYVEQLRQENAEHRVRAKRTDDLARRLHTALATATGRLADPTDLAFDEAHLDDPHALAEAIGDLLTRKPHLASRRPAGDIGQGAIGFEDDINLSAMLRSHAL